MPFCGMSPGHDDRLYSPHRDYAHNFPYVVAEVVKFLDGGRWLEMDAWRKEEGITDELLCDALEKYVAMVRGVSEEKYADLHDVAEDVGWLAVPFNVQLAICSTLGMYLTGCYFRGLREAAFGRSGVPTGGMEELVAAANDAAKFLMMSPARRRVHRFFRRIKEVFWPKAGLREK